MNSSHIPPALVLWILLSHNLAYGTLHWTSPITFFFLVILVWRMLDPPPEPDPLGQTFVTGQEEADRLIALTCPHCHLREWRIHAGENLCEITGKPFFLIATPYNAPQERP
jgi:hypothetical protein